MESMGVAGGCGSQEAGVVRIYRCCCKEVYRNTHNNYYFSLLHLY